MLGIGIMDLKALFIFVVLNGAISANSSNPKSWTDKVTLVTIVCDNGETTPEYSKISPNDLYTALRSFNRQKLQVLTMLKSILITWVPNEPDAKTTADQGQPTRLEILIFSNTRARFDDIAAEVNKWDIKYTHFLTLKFRQVTYPSEFTWMQDKFLPCSSFRALFPEQLLQTDPGLERVIHLDTDMLLFRDIRRLWETFNKFTDDTLVGAFSFEGNYYHVENFFRALNQRKSTAVKGKKIIINPGLLLVNLTNWRKSDNWLRWMKTKTIRKNLMQTEFPDKAGISAYLSSKHNSEQYFRLSNTWNFGTGCICCREYKDPACLPREGGVSLIHGHGGSFLLKSDQRMGSKIFRHFKNANLTHPRSPVTFVQSLRQKIRNEVRKCAKLGDQKVYCDNLYFYSKMILKYLNDLK